MRPVRPRPLISLLGAVVLVAAIFASVPASRYRMLQWMGRALVADDAPARADAIVVSSDALNAGYLEAADLVATGYGSRVVIFSPLIGAAEVEMARRGVESPTQTAAAATLILNGLGVQKVTALSPVVGTADEGRVLQDWCAANSIHSLLFVSVTDHSRRTRRVLDRALGQRGVKVMVRYARFSEFDPDSWWRSRGGQRTEVTELQKLLLDLVSHPF